MKKGNLLKRAWKGEAELWKVWWLLQIAVVIFRIVILGITEVVLIELARSHGWPRAICLTLGYIIFGLDWGAQVALWRMAWICAPNVQNSMWTRIARAVIVLAVLGSLAELVQPLGY